MPRQLFLIACALLVGVGAAFTFRDPTPRPSQPPPAPIIARHADAGVPTCASSVLREVFAQPAWHLAVEDLSWTDVRGMPDPLHQTVELDEQAASWHDVDLQWRTLALEPGERAALLRALEQPCEPLDAGNGFSGRYIAVSRDDLVLKLPAESRASRDAHAVLAQIRARYVALRLPVASTMRLTLSGRYRGDREWEPRTITLGPDGKLVDSLEGTIELSVEDRVDALDFASRLGSDDGSGAFTGTLMIGSATRPVAIRPDMHIFTSENVDALRLALFNWWRINYPVPDRK